MKHPLLFLIILLNTSFSILGQSTYGFRNEKLSAGERTADLIGRLTLEEKIALLGYRSKGVDRLGIPAYNWWNEALHGVARAGRATVFPQAIGMAASFNDSLLFKVADAISTEARARYNLAVAKDRRDQYLGLTFWSPNINLFRDPRWGRGQETYGEDPFLTSVMGMAFVAGLQGSDPGRLKASACAKHFAVHSGPESGRHAFNAIVDEKDLRDSYLYTFKKLVNSGVESVMCAYNRINGQPCCTGDSLLRGILRNEWGFKGHVVTDCWALSDVYSFHKSLPGSVETAAAAVKAGVNLDCSNLLQEDAMKALERGLISEKEVDSALFPVLQTQVKLGFYNDAGKGPYDAYGMDSIANDYHKQLAREMARQSMVLLKNDLNALPLDKNEIRSILVAGPNAASMDVLLGNYHGVSADAVTFVEGIVAAADPATRVEYDQGCDFTDTSRFGGTWASGSAEATIAVIGLSPVYEGEEGDAFLSAYGGDRKQLGLPASHIAYVKALRKATKNKLIVVVTGGGAMDVSSVEPYADAILLAWYPGEQGGHALADILFGDYAPSGRLPVTVYRSADDLPPFEDYAMNGRTYRYFSGVPAYPFGYGLSYTSFAYQWKDVPRVSGDSVVFSVDVFNKGLFTGDESVQVYFQYPEGDRLPAKELKGVRKVNLPAGSATTVAFAIPIEELKKWDLQMRSFKLFPGSYILGVGGNSSEGRLSWKLDFPAED